MLSISRLRGVVIEWTRGLKGCCLKSIRLITRHDISQTLPFNPLPSLLICIQISLIQVRLCRAGEHRQQSAKLRNRLAPTSEHGGTPSAARATFLRQVARTSCSGLPNPHISCLPLLPPVSVQPQILPPLIPAASSFTAPFAACRRPTTRLTAPNATFTLALLSHATLHTSPNRGRLPIQYRQDDENMVHGTSWYSPAHAVPDPQSAPANGYTEEEAGRRRRRSRRNEQEEEGHTGAAACAERYALPDALHSPPAPHANPSPT